MTHITGVRLAPEDTFPNRMGMTAKLHTKSL
jgi:hypothetical protein